MLHQTKHAKFEAQVAVPGTAGIETVNIYTVDLSAGYTAATDKIEVGLLPAWGMLTGITIIGGATGVGGNATFGIMNGDWGANDNSRVIDTVLMNAVTVHNDTANGDVDTLTDVAPADRNRSLGMTLSADVAAGSVSLKVIVRTINA